MKNWNCEVNCWRDEERHWRFRSITVQVVPISKSGGDFDRFCEDETKKDDSATNSGSVLDGDEDTKSDTESNDNYSVILQLNMFISVSVCFVLFVLFVLFICFTLLTYLVCDLLVCLVCLFVLLVCLIYLLVWFTCFVHIVRFISFVCFVCTCFLFLLLLFFFLSLLSLLQLFCVYFFLQTNTISCFLRLILMVLILTLLVLIVTVTYSHSRFECVSTWLCSWCSRTCDVLTCSCPWCTRDVDVHS